MNANWLSVFPRSVFFDAMACQTHRSRPRGPRSALPAPTAPGAPVSSNTAHGVIRTPAFAP